MQAERSSYLETFYSSEYWAQVPSEKGWSQTFDSETQLVVRIKIIRLASGERLRFFFCVPKPATKQELSDMQRRLRAIQAQKDSLVVANDRKLLAAKNAAFASQPKKRGRKKKRC